MKWQFAGELIYWRGPSPFHFVALPATPRRELSAVAPSLTYGWGCVPAQVRIGATTFTTSLFPKDGGYMVPIKADVRRRESLALGDQVSLVLSVGD